MTYSTDLYKYINAHKIDCWERRTKIVIITLVLLFYTVYVYSWSKKVNFPHLLINASIFMFFV